MSEQGMRFRLGVFVLAVLILLAGLVTLFGDFARFLTPAGHYTVTFANAAGVAPGTPVRRSGVPIGEVTAVELNNETGQVDVEIAVQAKYVIRPDDEPTLVHGLLGGETSIDLVLAPPTGRPPNRTPIAEGERLKGVNRAGVGTLLEQTSTVVPPAKETLRDMRKSLQAFERMTPLMEQTLREFRETARATRAMIPEWRGLAKATRAMLPELQELARESRKSIPELSRTGEQIGVAAKNWGNLGERLNVLVQTNEQKLQTSLDNLNRTLDGMAKVVSEENQRNLQRSMAGMANVFGEENQRNLSATLKNVRAGSDNLQAISKSTEELVRESRETIRGVNESVRRADGVLLGMQDAVKPWQERSRRITENLDLSMDRLNRCLIDLHELLRCIVHYDGTLRRLIVDPTLYNRLDEAACVAGRLLPRMDQVLRDLSVFADKVARHPEALGLGGVFRPSSGLKGNPTAGFYAPPGH
jgi:ABC-type transporter Mla subunit MlaD